MSTKEPTEFQKWFAEEFEHWYEIPMTERDIEMAQVGAMTAWSDREQIIQETKNKYESLIKTIQKDLEDRNELVQSYNRMIPDLTDKIEEKEKNYSLLLKFTQEGALNLSNENKRLEKEKKIMLKKGSKVMSIFSDMNLVLKKVLQSNDHEYIHAIVKKCLEDVS